MTLVLVALVPLAAACGGQIVEPEREEAAAAAANPAPARSLVEDPTEPTDLVCPNEYRVVTSPPFGISRASRLEEIAESAVRFRKGITWTIQPEGDLAGIRRATIFVRSEGGTSQYSVDVIRFEDGWLFNGSKQCAERVSPEHRWPPVQPQDP